MPRSTLSRFQLLNRFCTPEKRNGEGSTDSELLGNMADQSEGSTDSELLGNTTDEKDGSTDSELLGSTTDEKKGSTESVLLGNMASQTEGSIDSELLGKTKDEKEGSTESVLLGNMASQTEGSIDSELLGNVATQTEGSTESVLFENVATTREDSTDSYHLGNMATQSEGSCAGRKPISVNILILGDIGIGKTLIKSYLCAMNIDVEEQDIYEKDAIFAEYPLRMKHKEKLVDFGLIYLYNGTNSTERRECYPIGVNVIILCFSIGHYSTLRSVYNLWIHEIRSHFGKFTPVVLVGLRSDVRLIKPGTHGASIICQEGDRVVEKWEAEAIHKNYQFNGDYMECSISDIDSVIDVFKEAFCIAF